MVDDATKKTVLAHQLTGILFHLDCAQLYLTKGLWQMRRFHLRQAKEEMRCHMMTRDVLGYVELGDIKTVNLDDDIGLLWKSWEEKTLKLYTRLVEVDPSTKLWGKLEKGVRKELICLQKYVDADKMQTNEKMETAESL